MERTVGQWIFAEGNEVFGSEGDKVGKIVSVHPTYIVVEKGFFFPADYFIPMDAIASFDGERVVLSVTKDEALERDWRSPAETGSLSTDVAQFDASGAASYATSMDRLKSGDPDSNAAAALGATGHMGESASSPGLAGDLSTERPSNGDPESR